MSILHRREQRPLAQATPHSAHPPTREAGETAAPREPFRLSPLTLLPHSHAWDRALPSFLSHPPPSPPRSSRLATCITLTKELDGITVIVPDTNPDFKAYM